MVNPDNFIFHSDFIYSSPDREGRVVTTGPFNPTVLDSNIEAGNRVSVFLDDGTTIIGSGGPFAKLFYSIQGTNLIADSTVSAGAHYLYKIYKNPDPYVLFSDDKIDKVVFRKEGTVAMSGFPTRNIPNDYGKRMFITGMWRNTVGTDTQWYQLGQISGVDCTSSNIIFKYGGSSPSTAVIEYKFVGVDIADDPNDPYVFHSDKAVMSIPYTRTESINTSTSLTANQVKTTYSQWYDTGPGTLALSAWFYVDTIAIPTVLQEYQTSANSGVTVTAEIDASNRVRIKMVETNYSGSSISMASKNISVRFDMYHIIKY